MSCSVKMLLRTMRPAFDRKSLLASTANLQPPDRQHSQYNKNVQTSSFHHRRNPLLQMSPNMNVGPLRHLTTCLALRQPNRNAQRASDKPSSVPPADAYVMQFPVRVNNIINRSPTETDLGRPCDKDIPKMGLMARFKDMYKRYWYVMVPVHVVTSTGWMLGFYYLSQSGVDVPALLRSISVSESIVIKLENSTMGHLAIAYLCYKIFTPLRYMVTIGGTTVSIKYLSQWGYIKPIPSTERMLQLYDEKKAQMKRGYDDLHDKASSAMQKNKSDPKK